MADIDIERRSGGSVWAWIIGLLLLAALIWALVEVLDTDDEVVTEPAVVTAPVVTPATTPEVVGAAPGISIADILGNPTGYVGTDFTDEVTVAEVPTDRGFWIEDQGARMFVILIDQPAEQPLDINPGQTLRIDRGVLRDRTFLPQIPGEPLSAQTQQIAEQQPVFLTVDERNVTVLSQGSPQPGTDPAQMAPATGM